MIAHLFWFDYPFFRKDKLMFVVLLHRTIKYVIPRKGEALTWESPAPQFKFVRPN